MNWIMNNSNTSLDAPTISNSLLFEGKVSDNLLQSYRIYYFVIGAVVILPTVSGNVLVLMSIGRFSGLRKRTSHILLANLAVSDLLVGAVVFPVHMLLMKYEGFMKNMTVCLLHHSLIYTLVGVSVMNLFLVSLERFHAIKKPLTHATVFTKRRIYFTIAHVWVIMFLLGFLSLFGWHNKVNKDVFRCGETPLLSEIYTRIVCSILVVSLTVNAVFFFIVTRVALKAASSFTDITLTEDQHNRLKRATRYTMMMLTVSGLFIVFWAPFCVLTLVPNPSDKVKLATAWAASFGLISSSINWIVYCLRSERFRIAFKAILTCRYDKANIEISNLTS